MFRYLVRILLWRTSTRSAIMANIEEISETPFSNLCSCCLQSNYTDFTEASRTTTTIKVTTSNFSVSVKEIIILLLIFLLLLYSILSFLKSWNKNYRDIPSLPYHAICLDDSPQIATGLFILQRKRSSLDFFLRPGWNKNIKRKH